jgi:glucose/arabinose dehydrogenase
VKKAIGFIVFLIVLGIGGYFILQKYFPSLVPPSKDIKQYLPANNNTDTTLKIPSGYTLDVFADSKGERPTVLTFDPRGTLFASLTNTGKIVAFPDFDKNLKPERKLEIIKGLNKPFGIEFNGSYLYVAEFDKVSRYDYNSATMAVGEKKVLFTLPNGGKNPTRFVKIFNDKLYVSVGSSCNACVEKNEFNATLLSANLDGSNLNVFAKGLRNTMFFDIDKTGKIWGAEIGRSGLGNSLPPDEINLITENKDYGWPYCFGYVEKDYKMPTTNPVNCEHTAPSIYNLPAHSAPYGLVFDNNGDLLVALHGTKVSEKSVGYKIIRLSVFADSVSAEDEYLAGFVQGTNEVVGQPTGLAVDKNGNLFISDDRSGLIYILKK